MHRGWTERLSLSWSCVSCHGVCIGPFLITLKQYHLMLRRPRQLKDFLSAYPTGSSLSLLACPNSLRKAPTKVPVLRVAHNDCLTRLWHFIFLQEKHTRSSRRGRSCENAETEATHGLGVLGYFFPSCESPASSGPWCTPLRTPATCRQTLSFFFLDMDGFGFRLLRSRILLMFLAAFQLAVSIRPECYVRCNTAGRRHVRWGHYLRRCMPLLKLHDVRVGHM